MNILILGAAGQISRLLTDRLLQETDHSLVLFARNGSKRLSVGDQHRVRIVEGDFTDVRAVEAALAGIDVVYLNDVNSLPGVRAILKAMLQKGVYRLIAATILGIYDEVPGELGRWNERMVGRSGIRRHRQVADLIEASDLEYTLLRLTWLYNQTGNENYLLTQKGEPFEGAQVTREAVARLVLDILDNPAPYMRTSLGVGEPDTHWGKPSFY